MELHHRVELIDTLIEETDQKTQSLHHALHARERAEQTKGSSHGAPLTEEEQAALDRALKGDFTGFIDRTDEFTNTR